ncbi:LOW QUALITY PROTEIN: uncharacterized protein LOC127394265 [Apus apus]|uniref:LOW QUALITY PROTEIN: uncharacterized protein LOC127394265 n=1 Tax=Apus apus TaxID=8895 RepID=UPI0021F87F30|nr:LOW QUALITY PROTEIN: uncharacterized protein LOC127394265 [Apus apus]
MTDVHITSLQRISPALLPLLTCSSSGKPQASHPGTYGRCHTAKNTRGVSQEMKRQQCRKPGHSPYHYLKWFAFVRSLSEDCYFHRLPLGLRRCRATIKGCPSPSSLSHFSRLLLLGNQVHLSPRGMSCYNQCQPCCQPCGPTPLASSCNEPCCRQCQNSTIVIEPSPVVVTLPGPILSSFPQNTVVGSSTSAAVGSILSCDGVPINSGCCDLSCIASRYCGSRCRPC